jgi:hypothetical protein
MRSNPFGRPINVSNQESVESETNVNVENVSFVGSNLFCHISCDFLLYFVVLLICYCFFD